MNTETIQAPTNASVECADICGCHVCPDCEETIRGEEAECSHCGYECD